MSSNPEDSPSNESMHSIRYEKLTVHERDRYRCLSCWKTVDNPNQLDDDHSVPRGQGGSNCYSNRGSLCDACHEAKHQQRDHAPTIRCVSTGDMTQREFRLFKHFWREQVPALTAAFASARIAPVFNIADEKSYRAWHIPVGDICRLDRVLADADIHYPSLQAHEYM